MISETGEIVTMIAREVKVADVIRVLNSSRYKWDIILVYPCGFSVVTSILKCGRGSRRVSISDAL